MSSLRSLSAAARLGAIADAGSVDAVETAPRPSPHLARWGLATQDDDGIVFARARLHGAPVLIAAQDERYLGGSVGANHGEALRRFLVVARTERPAAVVMLASSGGVRLHEANPANQALSRAVRALLDLRAAGVPVLALGVGDVFGGMSIMGCAADRVALLPGTRVGLAGPRVLQGVHGTWEFDAGDPRDVAQVYGSATRAAAAQVALVVDDIGIARAWLATEARAVEPFDVRVEAMQARLAARLEAPVAAAPDFPLPPCFDGTERADAGGWIWKVPGAPAWLLRPLGAAALGPAEAIAQDAALLALAQAVPAGERTVVLVEDSAGHTVSRPAELAFHSQFLAHHAAVLALLRARGWRVIGMLAGSGHSGAFFVGAQQATTLFAAAESRVVAMEPAAIARVTGQDAAHLEALIGGDPVLGHPVRHFAQWGGVARIVPYADAAALLALLAHPAPG